jgi:hypothetical protein
MTHHHTFDMSLPHLCHLISSISDRKASNQPSFPWSPPFPTSFSPSIFTSSCHFRRHFSVTFYVIVISNDISTSIFTVYLHLRSLSSLVVGRDLNTSPHFPTSQPITTICRGYYIACSRRPLPPRALMQFPGQRRKSRWLCPHLIQQTHPNSSKLRQNPRPALLAERRH